MGRVYSPAELREGLIPQPNAQQEAARHIIERLTELEAIDPVLAREIACVVYGSTVTNKSDVRSDVDICASVYAHTRDTEQPSRAQQVFEGIVREAELRYGVYVEERVVAEEEFFKAGTYDDDGLSYPLDPLYVRHLITVADEKPDWVYGSMPLEGYRQPVFDPHGEDRAAVAWSALQFAQLKQAHIADAVKRAGFGDDEATYKDMQRAFELPKALGRKAVVVCGSEVGLAVTDKQAMHAWLNELASQQYDDGRLRSGQRALQALDGRYTELLQETLAGGVTLTQYERWLRENQLPALQLAKEIATQWGTVFEAHAHQVSAETGITREEALPDVSLY